MKIINKIQTAKLLGRGGAEFPVAFKWLSVAKGHLKEFNQPVYVICNGAEGEPGMFKDGFILQNYPELVIEGIKIAMDELGADKAYIYLRSDYLKKFKNILKKQIGKLPIELTAEKIGYLGGEETTLLETIEGDRPEPRLKPPYPTDFGLFGCPTLINNVETFYEIAKIVRGEYENKRFYCISGDAPKKGVYELPIDMSIGEILKTTKNVPRFEYFVQQGGGAAGEILTQEELNHPVRGAGSIIIHNLQKTDTRKLIKKWVDFFFAYNCGKCVPCREGLYRLKEMLDGGEEIDMVLLRVVLRTMRDTSFCPLGKSVYLPIDSMLESVKVIYKNKRDKKML
ncbi:MAG TPA: NADH-ubiquinone oxidoreductase-F iron-sulfur binding region domain-containing protein [Candidatus Magasanikbacteria bacterium]|nr:NADH-ubiquinone oxidoreductase-F iron-sulfur binding region domain-containing protein [Candidatus Magasanikbacteria bacterium]